MHSRSVSMTDAHRPLHGYSKRLPQRRLKGRRQIASGHGSHRSQSVRQPGAYPPNFFHRQLLTVIVRNDLQYTTRNTQCFGQVVGGLRQGASGSDTRATGQTGPPPHGSDQCLALGIEARPKPLKIRKGLINTVPLYLWPMLH